MKKQFALPMILALVFGLALAGPVSAAPINLTYSIFFPPTHGQCQAAMSWATVWSRVSCSILPSRTR